METRQRINRIIGQLKGIEVMIAEKRDCEHIMQQVVAVKKALNSVILPVIEEQLTDTLLSEEKKKQIIKYSINI